MSKRGPLVRPRERDDVSHPEDTMTMMKLNPSIALDGRAAEAIALYERALGARRSTVMRYREAPPTPGRELPAAYADRIMYSQLELGGDRIVVMDAPPGVPVPTESNLQISLEYDDQAEMQARFDALAAGGKVTMPIHDAFWGAAFGMLMDSLGVKWMFSCSKKDL